jgi:hypothetical protein
VQYRRDGQTYLDTFSAERLDTVDRSSGRD